MKPGAPSRTALGAASHRAAHQLLEGGRIFADPLAVRILGAEGEAALARSAEGPARRVLRLFIAVRSRYAEDTFAAAFARGVRQLVILGAGLDTYAYRTGLDDGLRIVEVDHPDTQAWKRQRLTDAGIAVPAHLSFAPVDFETTTLRDGLAAAGFDPAQAAFFIWLGVVPYLTESAVFGTLEFIGGLPGGGQVVFDYANPPAPGEGDAYASARAALSARVAAAGEAFQSAFETAALHARLRELGLGEIEDLGPAQIRERYFGSRGTAPRDAGGHVIHAATASRPAGP